MSRGAAESVEENERRRGTDRCVKRVSGGLGQKRAFEKLTGFRGRRGRDSDFAALCSKKKRKQKKGA